MNIYKFFPIILIFSIIGCNSKKENSYQLGKENSVVVDNIQGWETTKDKETVLRPCIDMDIRFLNNPYCIDDNICIYLNENNLIYKGKFSEGIDVCVPDSLIGKTIYPALQIFKSGKTYNLMGKSTIEILQGDKYLNIVFMPERGVFGGCIMFSNRVELQ